MTSTKIGVSVETREQLKHIGSKGDTYDDIISFLISFYTGEARIV